MKAHIRTMRSENRRDQAGYVLVAVLMLVALVAAMLSAHFLLTQADLSTTRSTMVATRGFYAAEAGLNLRAQSIRERFEGYRHPEGTTPVVAPGSLPCEGDMGEGDFACEIIELGGRSVSTYLEEDPSNPTSILIPAGEPYQNLHAQEYRYTVSSVAVGPQRLPEAILEMRFRSRLVPMFQFAAFYNKDLEIYPGPPMALEGPVHCNGDLYAGAQDGLLIRGDVTVSRAATGNGGRLFNGRKFDACCASAEVAVWDGAEALTLPSGPGRNEITANELAPWHGRVRTQLATLTVPPPEVLDPLPGQIYWDEAELRLVLDLDAGTIEVRNQNGTRNDAATADLSACAGSLDGRAVAHTNGFYNHREGQWIQMLDVDLRALLDCAHEHPALFQGRGIDDATHGGLVLWMGVERDDVPIGTVNPFGVRVRRGASLAATSPTAPAVRGLTIVTNQAFYAMGDYNSSAGNWKPSAFLADSINILSNAWNDAASDPDSETPPLAQDTSILAAFLAGTDSTGGAEQPLDGGSMDIYNGGLENYPRLHENWTDRTLIYRGSFVSLSRPRHVSGTWRSQHYDPPDRDWAYDTRFNDARNLPPLTPRFVYLTQELFVREYDY